MKRNAAGIISCVAVSICIIIVLAVVATPFFAMFFALREGKVALDEGRHLAMNYDPNKPTDFFSIIQHMGELAIDEHFVVANAPIDRDEIFERIADFNRRSITVDMIKTHTFSRSFYRETQWLTRDFREGEPYPQGPPPGLFLKDDIQEIRTHLSDLFLRVTYFQVRNGVSTRLRYRFSTGEIFEEHIDNIHIYFADRYDNVLKSIPTIDFYIDLENYNINNLIPLKKDLENITEKEVDIMLKKYANPIILYRAKKDMVYVAQ